MTTPSPRVSDDRLRYLNDGWRSGAFYEAPTYNEVELMARELLNLRVPPGASSPRVSDEQLRSMRERYGESPEGAALEELMRLRAAVASPRDAAIAAHIPLRFVLKRNKDRDVAATGVLFGDGHVVLRWIGEHPSTQTYANWGDAMRIHHIGEPNSGERWTTAEWLDGVCFACGSSLHHVAAFFGGNGAQCCACSSSWDGPPSREIGGGTWIKAGTLPARNEP